MKISTKKHITKDGLIKNNPLKKCQFLGSCDRVRQNPNGEEFWQEMMKYREEISEKEFLKAVNIDNVLDKDERWEEYKENARMQGDPIKFYKSINGVYFFQTAGFEFIWMKQ